jgi:iron complex transport system substrate-binding protein
VFGTFYGKKSNLNKEALMASNAEIVLDIGNIKGSADAMAKDLDELSKTIAMPVIFLSGEIEEYPMVFEVLGTLTGNEEAAAKLKAFSEDALEYASKIKEEYSGKVSVYYSPSDDGLEAVEKGSSHSEIIDLVGADNIVPTTFSSSNGQVNLENLYKWDPDVIILSSKEAYDSVTTESAWAPLKAVENNRVYLMSAEPYPLIDMPTSTQRLLGIYYLGKVLFDDDIDLISKTKEFYNLFYHYEITDEEAKRILNL